MKEEYILVKKMEGHIISEVLINKYEYMTALNLNKRLRNKTGNK